MTLSLNDPEGQSVLFQFKRNFSKRVDTVAYQRKSGRGTPIEVRRLNALARACHSKYDDCVAIAEKGNTFYVAGNDLADAKSAAEKLGRFLKDAKTKSLDEDYWKGKTRSLAKGRTGTTVYAFEQKLAKGARILNEYFNFLRNSPPRTVNIVDHSESGVHAECRIVAQHRDVERVGISKLCCTMCYLCVDARLKSIHKTSPFSGKVSGGHGGVYDIWKLPRVLFDDPDFLSDFLGDTAYKLLIKFNPSSKKKILREIRSHYGGESQNATSGAYSSDSDAQDRLTGSARDDFVDKRKKETGKDISFFDTATLEEWSAFANSYKKGSYKRERHVDTFDSTAMTRDDRDVINEGLAQPPLKKKPRIAAIEAKSKIRE